MRRCSMILSVVHCSVKMSVGGMEVPGAKDPVINIFEVQTWLGNIYNINFKAFHLTEFLMLLLLSFNFLLLLKIGGE